jgi:hypothetical protein
MGQDARFGSDTGTAMAAQVVENEKERLVIGVDWSPILRQTVSRNSTGNLVGWNELQIQ